MKQAKIFIVFTFLLAFAFQIPAQQLKVKDKAEVVRQSLESIIEELKKPVQNNKFDSCLTPVINEKQVVFLLSENIENLSLPEIKDYRFQLFTRQEINDQSRQGNQCHFEFGKFDVRKNRVVINVSRIVNLPTGIIGDTGYRGGIAYQQVLKYEFIKSSSGWKINSFSKL